MGVRYFNFFIAISALAFQIGVLYPWHHTISHQVDKLDDAVRQLNELAEIQEIQIDSYDKQFIASAGEHHK